MVLGQFFNLSIVFPNRLAQLAEAHRGTRGHATGSEHRKVGGRRHARTDGFQALFIFGFVPTPVRPEKLAQGRRFSSLVVPPELATAPTNPIQPEHKDPQTNAVAAENRTSDRLPGG